MTAPKQSESKYSKISLCYLGYLEYTKGLEMTDEEAKSALCYLHDSGSCKKNHFLNYLFSFFVYFI